jgi:hypothetical protein
MLLTAFAIKKVAAVDMRKRKHLLVTDIGNVKLSSIMTLLPSQR